MWRLLILGLVGYFGWYYGARYIPVSQPPGILIPQPPVQEIEHLKPFEHGEHTLQPVARYTIEGRVISTYRYPDNLAPYDLALGWQEMSDSAVLDRLKIYQVNRFYFYRWQNPPPIPPERIIRTSANNHIIPANDAVRKQLQRVREGQLVRLKGYLVNASKPDGWRWNSSQTREDTGDGGCEILYTQSIEWLEK
jgi:hypothetical protein